MANIFGGESINERNQRLGMELLEQRQGMAEAQQQAQQQQNIENNTALFSALGGDALQNPAMAQQAQQLVGLPTPQAVSGLQALMQRGQQQTASFAQQQALERRALDQPIIARLNDRYLAQMKAPVNVQDALAQLENALSTGSSIGAVAATVKLAKILDPESVVREGEVRTVEGGLGIADQIIRALNNVEGQGFGPDAVKDLLELAQAVATPVLERGRLIESQFGQMAVDAQVSPEQVTSGIGFLVDPLPQPGEDGVWGGVGAVDLRAQ